MGLFCCAFQYVFVTETVAGPKQKTVHEELAQYLKAALRPNQADQLIVSKFLKHIWFFFKILVKSMAQYLLSTDRIKVYFVYSSLVFFISFRSTLFVLFNFCVCIFITSAFIWPSCDFYLSCGIVTAFYLLCNYHILACGNNLFSQINVLGGCVLVCGSCVHIPQM